MTAAGGTIMQARMQNPAIILPDAMQALMALNAAAEPDDLPLVTRKLVHLRASQINGCGACVDMHSRELKKAEQADERIFGVAAKHYAEKALAALLVQIALINVWNRFNVSVKQLAGGWK